MSVYVDDMYKHPMGQFRRMKMSHMIADTEAELHAMADKIGLQRKWYQQDHYDVAMVARAKAVFYGAVEITMREMAFKRNPRLKRYAGPITFPPELLPYDKGAEVVVLEPGPNTSKHDVEYGTLDDKGHYKQ